MANSFYTRPTIIAFLLRLELIKMHIKIPLTIKEHIRHFVLLYICTT